MKTKKKNLIVLLVGLIVLSAFFILLLLNYSVLPLTGKAVSNPEENLDEASDDSDYAAPINSESPIVNIISGRAGGGGSSGSENENDAADGNQESQQVAQHFKLNHTSSRWMDFYGNLEINEKPAEIGDEIAAFDADGNLCGVFLVKDYGSYGFLHVYEDDSDTENIDEGAVDGEQITFRVFDSSENKERGVSGSAIWKAYEKKEVDLVS